MPSASSREVLMSLPPPARPYGRARTLGTRARWRARAPAGVREALWASRMAMFLAGLLTWCLLVLVLVTGLPQLLALRRQAPG